METGPDHEGNEDNMHENGEFGLSGQRVHHPLPAAIAARGVRSDGLQIVVPTLFQY